MRARLFGPSQGDVWTQFADAVDGDFTDGGFFRPDVVHAKVGEWTVTLDTYTTGGEAQAAGGGAQRTFTRMRAPYLNSDGFGFAVCRAGLFTPLGRLLGAQDIEVGDAQFDRDFVIKGNDEAKVRALFPNDRIRNLIRAQRSIRFEVKDDEGWFRQKFPDGVDELYFSAAGIIKDLSRLRLLFDLFAETLNQLCHIDSAYEDDPELIL
ncbi:DUF3137 domain-containing protein [Candidatus Poribacteria bacterium]|jgi:hypothetical protein|nr:DUF3137 domain-containing protein [Candidatus Poribacteria bacterium]MBT5535497.1 DUF3137 domain-containing protein [Candidatus Poribacteria bacterium]MBT7096978.1 DUF3137 domain-containing protein [Candidatus Poribacteria bacterium]MBT7806067.1 DUF3137 domain-containing protein [Candidatus Poribacteria bacterium]